MVNSHDASGIKVDQAGLEARSLCCRRGGRDLFRKVEFSLGAGDFLFVRGENGCGKTTLLRALCGLTRPVAGTVLWCGRPIAEQDAFAGDLLYIGHREAVKDELSPLENLQVHGGLRGESHTEEARERALSRVGLAGYEDIPVRYLSQGQRRRCALARLVLSEAPLWILDEPYNALDRGAVDWLSGLVREHLGRGGMVVATSHQPIEGVGDTRVLELG